MLVAKACAAGLGLAVLPCFVADTLPALQRVGEPLPELDTQAWLLTHADLRDTVRIRVVMDALQDGFAAMQARLEGAGHAPVP
jgi:DNA-binding transcriptional LysR family regulator